MTKKYKISLILLGFIFLIGLFLRLYRLDQNVPALYADEVGHYFIYHNFINRPINYLFSATWLVGLNPLGVRLFSAIYGSLVILLGFYFAKEIARGTATKLYLRIALIFALLVAVLPWNFGISRLGHTHIPLVVLLSLLHLTLYLKAKNWQQILISFIPFILGSYYYPTLIIMSPLVLLLPAKELIFENKLNKKYIISILIVLSVAIGYFLINKYKVLDTSSRVVDLAIWRDVNVTADSNLYRGLARLSNPTIFSFGVDTEELANKLVFNYPISVLTVFTKNYLSFFSPGFLFLKGDSVLRHSTGMVGEFYLFLLPFMIYGAFLFFRDQTQRNKTIFLIWILASPLPAAITKDGATYSLRAITLMPFLTYFCALGIVTSFDFFKRKYLRFIYGAILIFVTIFSTYYYFFGYFHVYPALSADSFEYGFKELSDFQSANQEKLLIIWEDKYPVNHFCFWQNPPSSVCVQAKMKTRENIGQSQVDLPIPKLLFSLPSSEPDLEKIVSKYKPKNIAIPHKYLYLFPNFTMNHKIVEEIKNPDQTTSFNIYEI